MSKRSRGGRRPTANRAGQRGRTTSRPTRPVSQLEAAEVAAEDIEHGELAAAANELERAAASAPRGPRAKPGSLLATRAAEEYVYVAQDLRRIALVAVLLFGILFGLWILIEALGLFGQ